VTGRGDKQHQGKGDGEHRAGDNGECRDFEDSVDPLPQGRVKVDWDFRISGIREGLAIRASLQVRVC
jgi:hypothetical protein